MRRCCSHTAWLRGGAARSCSVASALSLSQFRFYRPTAAADPAAVSSLSSSPTSALSAAQPTGAAPQTYFDYLDRMWNAKWFGTVDDSTVAAHTASAATADPSLFAQGFTACQQSLGVEAGALIFLVGALTRACTLVFSLYGERAGERMRLALPVLKQPQAEFNRVYYNDLASAMEVQMAASVLKSHRRAVFRKYDTSNVKCVASLAMAPVVMTGLYQVSALCDNAALDVGSSAFLWCGALTLPDPFMILPIASCVATLLNFELSISKEIKTGWMRTIIWGARLGCLCVIPVFATFRSGVCLYLVGMNVVGLLQPLLLRSAAFRRWFAFPTAEALAAVTAPAEGTGGAHPGRPVAAHSPAVHDRATALRDRVVAAVGSPSARAGPSSAVAAAPDVLQASVTVQFPYLSHLLNPQVEENEELFAKARSKQSKPDFGRHGPITSAAPAAGSRYARGANPLMRETPRQHLSGSSATAATAAAAAAVSASSSPSPPAAAGEGEAGRRGSKSKGSSFASSGWKSTQLSFDESDFIPEYNEGKTTSSSVASFFSKRK